ncbi:MAG: S-layer homology domain-containing protein [Oscillospiraceae bacterium]|nr:S-layer homology domain-containing protein [Oscillospiraceae bacterium]
MKRNLGALLVLALLLTLCVPFVAAADARVTVEVPAAYPKAGETFSATVSLDGNPGLYSAQFILCYDKTAMTCNEVDLGDALLGAAGATNPNHAKGAIVGAASGTALTKDGVLAEFTFTAKKDVTAWDFTLDDLLLAGKGGKAITCTVTLPQKQTSSGQTQTGSAPPETLLSITFSDVAASDWYREWVMKAVSRGLFKGNADGTFHPNDPITRAQFVTVLWRMADKPAPKAAAPFADVAGESAEFRDAIAWAQENGIVQGVSQTAFSPRGKLTREAAMTILFRLAGAKSGMETLMTKIYDDGFTDSGAISAWAKPALYWGYYNGIISGTGTKTLSPQGTATRAQIAKILVGYQNKEGTR